MKGVGVGRASGKIILMGEHSVVYGEPAIAFPFLATQVKAELNPHFENEIISEYYEGLLATVPTQLKSLKTLSQLLQKDLDLPKMVLTLESSIPGERGMGSSAAVAVAITRAYFDLAQVTLSQDELLHYVDLSEKIAHGNPSGIDAAATSGQEPILFEKGQAFEEFPLNINAYLVVADTGVKGRTRETVKSVAHHFETNPKTTGRAIKRLGDLTREAKAAIIADEVFTLGQAMNEAQIELATLGVSNQTLNRLIKTAIDHGAIGAKLTGGGRGGCMIALAKDQDSAKVISQALTHQGAKSTWIQQLGVVSYV